MIQLHIEKLPEGVYLATSDEVQGLVAQGRTIQETIEIARDVATRCASFFTAGLVRARDAVVRSAELLTVPGRKRPLLMVVIESAGSGGYLAADVLAIEPHAVRLAASVGSLAPSEDPTLALRRKLGPQEHPFDSTSSGGQK